MAKLTKEQTKTCGACKHAHAAHKSDGCKMKHCKCQAFK